MGRLLLLPMIFFCLSIQGQETGDACPTISYPMQEFCDYVYNEAESKVFPAIISDIQISADSGKTVVWYSEDGETLPGDYQLVDGAIYYAGYSDGSCSSKPSVTVKVDRQPVAGRTSTVYLCSNSGPVHIYDLMPLLSDGTFRPAESGGSVNPPLASGGTLFDPAKDKGGIRYTYTTQDSKYSFCGPDSARILIHIVEGADAGENAEAYFETIHPAQDLFNFLNGSPDLGGSWTPPLADGIFDPKVNLPGVYTYTVFGEGVHCEKYSSSATVLVTVNDVSTTVCHDGETVLVKNNSLKAHLKHGDVLGSCEDILNAAIVSPNPSRGKFSVTSKTAEIRQVKILDFNGVMLKSFNNREKGKIMELDITDLKRGIYFVEIRTNNGKQTERLIKE